MKQVVVITGISGSGKSLAARCLEDLGFFCVDNLPVDLVESFCRLGSDHPGRLDQAAIVVDVRDHENLHALPTLLTKLLDEGVPLQLLFFECNDTVLKRRFSETRRPHPMADEGRTLLEAIQLERGELKGLREHADRIIDTSQFNAHELRSFLKHAFGDAEAGLNVNVISFGFKYGLPTESDLVFDLRFLPNPYFVQGLRARNGKEKEVQDYLAGFPETDEFKQRLFDFIDFLLPHYSREGKSYLSIALGCTGGKHRSVAMTEALSEYLTDSGHTASITHRDLGLE